MAKITPLIPILDSTLMKDVALYNVQTTENGSPALTSLSTRQKNIVIKAEFGIYDWINQMSPGDQLSLSNAVQQNKASDGGDIILSDAINQLKGTDAYEQFKQETKGMKSSDLYQAAVDSSLPMDVRLMAKARGDSKKRLLDTMKRNFQEMYNKFSQPDPEIEKLEKEIAEADKRINGGGESAE